MFTTNDMLTTMHTGNHQKTKSADEHFKDAANFYSQSRYQEALGSFKEYLKIRPGDPLATTNMCNTLYALGNYDAVLEHSANCLMNSPDYVPALVIHAHALFALKLYSYANTLYEKILKIDPHHKVVEIYKQSLAQIENSRNTGIEAARQALTYEALSKGKKLEQAEDLQNALTLYNDLIKKSFQDTKLFVARGCLLIKLNKYDESLSDFNIALKYEPINARVIMYRSRVLRKMNRLKEALANANAVVKVLPKDADALVNLGLVQEYMKSFDEALQSYGSVLESNPNHIVALKYCSRVLFDMGQFQEALIYLRRLSLMEKPSFPTQMLHFQTLVRMNLYQLALDYINKWIPEKQLNTLSVQDQQSILCYRALSLIGIKKPQEALVELDKALALGPDEFLYKYRAELLEELGEFNKARQDYKQVIMLATAVAVSGNETTAKKMDEAVERNQRQQKGLEKQLGAKDTSEDTMVQLQQQIKQLQEQQTKLLVLLDLKNNSVKAEELFKSNPNLWSFYRTINLKLEEIFIGCKTVASGFVENQQKGKLDQVATGISLLGKIFSLIPVIGNVIEQGLSAGSTALKKIDQVQQLNILKNISSLGTIAELTRISEVVARELTERYREQLLKLPISSNDKSLIETLKIKFLSENATSVAHDLAEYGLLKMLEGLLSNQITMNSKATIEEQLIDTVMSPIAPSFKDQLSQKMGLHIFPMLDGQQWSLYDFYQKPAVRTPDQLCFVCDHSDPQKYGYRIAQSKDVQRWGMKQMSAAVQPSAVVFSKAPIKTLSVNVRKDLLAPSNAP